MRPGYTLRPATASDVAAIKACIDASYGQYVQRIGLLPGPMDPVNRGKGLGRILLELAEAEARRAGFDSIYLYTHQRMTENQALYAKIGYVEYDRRVDEGLPRAYMRKLLAGGRK